MTTVSAADFALHMQSYLDQAMQGEKIRIQLKNERFISLIPETTAQPIKKQYTKADLLKQLAYQGGLMDSQEIDQLIYK